MADGDSSSRPPGRRSALTVDVLLPTGTRAPGLARWLQAVAPARARGSVTVAVVTDARVRKLNRAYRKKDANTDVLSFPSEDRTDARPRFSRADVGPGFNRADVGPGFNRADVGPGFSRAYLGDIVIAGGVARRQAREAGHSLQTELRVLALHGLLHLLGYDHAQDDGRMARLERRLRRKGGLREGLIERAAP